MVRWGLSESNLPPGYEVINRGPSLWREHKYTIVLVLLFILVETVLIVSLLAQRRQKRKAERGGPRRGEPSSFTRIR